MQSAAKSTFKTDVSQNERVSFHNVAQFEISELLLSLRLLKHLQHSTRFLLKFHFKVHVPYS